MAWCPFAVRRELPRAHEMAPMDPRAIVHHTAVSNASSLYGEWASQPPQKNGLGYALGSHYYIDRDGNIEQYYDTERRVNAQYAANAFAISIESWDGGHPENTPWNDAQVAAFVKLDKWLCDTHAIPKAQCASQTSPGIGWHSMWGNPDHPPTGWNWEAHSCPAGPRIAQMPGIIFLVQANPPPPEVPDMMTTLMKGSGPAVFLVGEVATHVRGGQVPATVFVETLKGQYFPPPSDPNLAHTITVEGQRVWVVADDYIIPRVVGSA